MPHWKMEWDQQQAGARRAGLQNTALLKGPSQNLAGQGSQAVLAALLSMVAGESESFQDLVDGEKGLPLRRARRREEHAEEW